MRKKLQRNGFKEVAGVLCAFLVVMAFVLIGFSQMATTIMLGTTISAPSDWMAAMLSLASAALGFLIGKNVQQEQESANGDLAASDPYASQTPTNTCPSCGMPLDATGQHSSAGDIK